MSSALPDSLLFDLDGTLWNACGASAEGFNRGLQSLGLNERVTHADVATVTGLPYDECLRRLLPQVAPERFPQLFSRLNECEREAVEEKGGVLFTGVADGIRQLSQRFDLCLVSNCQSWYLEAFFRHSLLGGLFRDFESYGATGLPKHENIRRVIERNGLRAPVYIGDTEYDAAAARRAGVEFVHVRWGFGLADATHAFDSFDALVRHFMR